MTTRDGMFLVLGWQIAIAVRLICELILDAVASRRRKARRTRTAEQTTP